MNTRCKMKLYSITEQADQTCTKFDEHGEIAVDENGQRLTEQGPAYTLKFVPVYHNNDPKHENSRYWAYSPSGEFTLGTVNGRVAKGLVVGKEYYVDITPAE